MHEPCVSSAGDIAMSQQLSAKSSSPMWLSPMGSSHFSVWHLSQKAVAGMSSAAPTRSASRGSPCGTERVRRIPGVMMSSSLTKVSDPPQTNTGGAAVTTSAHNPVTNTLSKQMEKNGPAFTSGAAGSQPLGTQVGKLETRTTLSRGRAEQGTGPTHVSNCHLREHSRFSVHQLAKEVLGSKLSRSHVWETKVITLLVQKHCAHTHERSAALSLVALPLG